MYFGEMSICCQFQALLLCPLKDSLYPPLQPLAPDLGDKFGMRRRSKETVEEEYVDKVENLREKLNGEGSVDPTSPKQCHHR